MSENPFFVLGVPTTASRQEVERAAQKLLAQLSMGVKSAATLATPQGPRPRTEDDVRAAAAALRDPEARLIHELLAEPLPPLPAEGGPAPTIPDLFALLPALRL